jgi:hypothetical protein
MALTTINPIDFSCGAKCTVYYDEDYGPDHAHIAWWLIDKTGQRIECIDPPKELWPLIKPELEAHLADYRCLWMKRRAKAESSHPTSGPRPAWIG